MEKLPAKKLIFASPWILITAVGLLLAIILVFAVNNLQREQRLANETLFNRGQGIIRFLEAGTRASMMRMGVDDASLLQHLIEQAAEDTDILYIAVISQEGRILAHSEPDLVSRMLPFPLPPQMTNDTSPSAPARVSYRLREDPAFPAGIFEVSAPFTPFAGRGGRHGMMMEPGQRQRMRQVWQHHEDGAGMDPEALGHQGRVILVGLDRSEAAMVISQNRRHILFISLALLLVGIGGWLALLGAQGYRTAEKTLQYVQAFTGLLISRLPLGIIAVDQRGLVTTCNEVAAQMGDLRAEKVIGRPAAGVLPALLAPYLAEPTSGAEIIDREIKLAAPEPTGPRPDDNKPGQPQKVRLGEESPAPESPAAEGKRTVMVSAVPVRNRQQKIIGRVLLLHDVTELQAMEREIHRHERLVALGKMAAGVAHEIRNPLSSIKGLATLLGSRFGEQDREHDAARLLISEVERVNRSIGELLNYARPQPLNRQSVRLNELLANSLQLVAADARVLGVELDFQPAAGSPALAIDADRITQVLLNLYLNSLQAMSEGGRLQVRAREDLARGEIQISVSDSGCGIAAENLARITDPYFTTKPEGSGLGLAMVQKIIEEHGGRMAIASQEGRGTTVTISLPRSPQPANGQAQT
jgi:two-component system, NtrC family, sensor histidine kinase HydH